MLCLKGNWLNWTVANHLCHFIYILRPQCVLVYCTCTVGTHFTLVFLWAWSISVGVCVFRLPLFQGVWRVCYKVVQKQHFKEVQSTKWLRCEFNHQIQARGSWSEKGWLLIFGERPVAALSGGVQVYWCIPYEWGRNSASGLLLPVSTVRNTSLLNNSPPITSVSESQTSTPHKNSWT